jgi:hypothetical protein
MCARREALDAARRRLGTPGVVGWLYVDADKRCPGDAWGSDAAAVHLGAIKEFRHSPDALIRAAVAWISREMLRAAYKRRGAPGLIRLMRDVFGHLLASCATPTPDDLRGALRAFQYTVPCAATNEEAAVLRSSLNMLRDAHDAENIRTHGLLVAAGYLTAKLNHESIERLQAMRAYDALCTLAYHFSKWPGVSVAVDAAVCVLRGTHTT